MAAAPVPLKRHSYPVWLSAFALAVLGALAYSLMLAEPYLDVYLSLQRAEAAYERGDRAMAEAQYTEVLTAFPSSERGHIGIAIVLLSHASEAKQLAGFNHLTGIKLNNSDYQRILKVIPEKYRGNFRSVKK